MGCRKPARGGVPKPAETGDFQTGANNRKAKVTADSGFHTEESMKSLSERNIDGYVPDKLFRRRDPAFKAAARHRSFKALIGRDGAEKKFFTANEVVFNPHNGNLPCPAGKELYTKHTNFWTTKGFYGTQYMAKKTDCCVFRTKPTTISEHADPRPGPSRPVSRTCRPPPRSSRPPAEGLGQGAV